MVELNVEKNYVRTAGADGYVRYWDYEKLNDIEPDEDSHTVALEPIRTVWLGEDMHIKTLVEDNLNDQWIILVRPCL